MIPLISTLVAAVAFAGAGGLPSPAPVNAAGATRLDVPYVPQTDALCGGAAVAMVLRYWGDRHAGVEEFASLVDRRAKGIRSDALVATIERRGWHVTAGASSIERLGDEIRRGRPVVILIEDRPSRYHYVVVVGEGAGRVTIHDPAWGPERELSAEDLRRRWSAAEFWAATILPPKTIAPDHRERRAESARSRDTCDELVDAAVERVQREGLGSADTIFGALRERCAGSAGPLRELAGVRFAQHRWRDAQRLAEQALSVDPSDEYAWDLLGSSRFVQDDRVGALDAWNHIDKPRLDSVHIDGLSRTRYASIAGVIGLPTGTLLTVDRFGRAEKRLADLPGVDAAHLDYRTDADGFATLSASLVEADPRPRSPAGWAARAAAAAVDREVTLDLPGKTGQGELWSGSWRWWSDRPRVAFSFASPHAGTLAGIWRVDASWEQQAYTLSPGAPIRESRARGALGVSDWLAAGLRYEVGGGIDAWNGRRRAAFVSGALERRIARDAIGLNVDFAAWAPLDNQPGFRQARMRAAFRSTPSAAGTVLLADAGAELTSAGAPLSLWSGAGDGHARAPLARAHPLLDGGTITGPLFGRELEYAHGEAQRWLASPRLPGVGLAGFVDVARASRRAIAGNVVQVDTGFGLRVRAPGARGTFRVDLARGLRDGAVALTIGLQY